MILLAAFAREEIQACSPAHPVCLQRWLAACYQFELLPGVNIFQQGCGREDSKQHWHISILGEVTAMESRMALFGITEDTREGWIGTTD
jgi:hypothetical protein